MQKSSINLNSNLLKHDDLQPELAIYYWMSLVFALDKKARALHSQGHLATFPSSRGQEALFVALGQVLSSADSYLPYYRDHGCLLQRGYTVEDILKYWGGFTQGNQSGYAHDFSICVPIASQTTHAVGAAWRYKNSKDRIVATMIGDGGTSKGDFYESLNFACIHKLPVLYVINCNNWAISTPLSSQSASSLLDKFSGFGAMVSEVDGMHYKEIEAALTSARQCILQGFGPQVIICQTHRLDPHTVLDDYSKYVDKLYIDNLRKQFNPIANFKNYLLENINCDQSTLDELTLLTQSQVDDAAQSFIDYAPPSFCPKKYLFSYE